MIKTVLAVVLGLAGLALWGFSAFDIWATLSGYAPYLESYPPEMIAWMQGFPLWRKLLWGLSIGLGVLGALLLLFRTVFAGHVLTVAFVLMIGGFLAYDLPFANGAEMYGRDGLIGSTVLCLVAFGLAIAAYSLARKPAHAP